LEVKQNKRIIVKFKAKNQQIKRVSLYSQMFDIVFFFSVSDEYFDSSDGTSDIDEEISQLQNTIQALTAERDRLKQEMLGQ
jgi:archaellum component FlaC